MADRHERWTDQLSDYLNGDLHHDEAAEVEAHLASCGACRDALAELRELVAAARALGEVQPEADLWPGIAAAIAAPVASTGATVIQLPTALRDEGARDGLFLSRRQLAAAASLLVMISAAATWAIGVGIPGGTAGTMATAQPPAVDARLASTTPTPPTGMAEEIESLEALMAEVEGALDPATVRILEKNLAVIEAAIADSYRALEVDPGNEFLREHLERTYRRKVDYLQNAVRVAGWSG